MVMQASDDLDLIQATQAKLERNKWTDISLDKQNYIAMKQIFREEKVVFDSGTSYEFRVQTGNAGSAKTTGLFAVDDVNVVDVMTHASVPWRHLTCNWAIERREMKMNRTPQRIVNLVKLRRHVAMNDLAELGEEILWGKPDDSDDTATPFGLAYWCVKNSSSTGAFDGGNPSGFTSGAAGISSVTYPNWANWTNTYTNVTKSDAIAKWRQASRKTNFMAPNPHPNLEGGDTYGYYTNDDVIGELESRLEEQNDNLGNSVNSKDGRTMFSSRPVNYASYLDDDSTDPIYGINWDVFYPVFLEGEYMFETPAKLAPNQHTVYESFIDCTLNFVCTNRRRLFVIAKSS